MEERLQKILSRAGYGSRRSCEELIRDGRVRVNGQTATLGSKADASKDRITLDGATIPSSEQRMYYALHKPRGVVSTVSDPLNRKIVRDFIPVSGTLYPVGRLDEDSEGLVLMTNDGDLANLLTHPKFGHEKEYKVLVARQPDERQLEAMRHGIILEDGYRTAPAEIHMERAFGKGAWLRVILKEGRKRQIREMGERIGLPVVRIVRVRIGSLHLGSLKPGEWRELKPDEVKNLRQPSNALIRKSPRSTSKKSLDVHKESSSPTRKTGKPDTSGYKQQVRSPRERKPLAKSNRK